MNIKEIVLSEAEVVESRTKHGDNTLTTPPRESLWRKFGEKFTDPIIIILLIALLLSTGVAAYHFCVGDGGLELFLEPLGIFVAVLLSTLIGFIFEMNANKRFDLLNRTASQGLVKVVREGAVREISQHDIVVGDIIIVESGDEISADAHILESVSLQVNESSLTGEPMASKSCREEECSSEATYPTNLILRGTTVVEGHGVARVCKVGDHTEYGKVYRGAQIDNSIKTPLNRELEGLASLIAKMSYAVATLVVVGRAWAYFAAGIDNFEWIDFGGYMLNTIMLAVTLVVVSVPEGLPMSVTLSLALSMKRMLKENNLVRKMHACETMGATTVICTDKTGTLTQNKMQVHESKFYNRDDHKAIYEGVAVNTTAHLEEIESGKHRVLGNPTEGALLLWLEECGADYRLLREQSEIVAQLPFSTERKYMATAIRSGAGEQCTIYIKGAPEVIIAMSSGVDSSVVADLKGYQNMAMRTLAFASTEVKAGVDIFADNRLPSVDYTFLGIVAISDPVREDVPMAIEECRTAGIDVKIVTGDTSATAMEIARQIGLCDTRDTTLTHMTGAQFEATSDEELLGKVQQLKVISRARPMDKQRLVQLLQRCNEVVAVTGDGTNDAPALKAAHVGLSMGDGTSVAKEASDITIVDNSFSTISKSVMWGRSLYRNIQRFILFQLTINVAASIVVLLSALFGMPSPLTVTQMLWVNLIMDTFAALALASLPPSKSVMKSAPRRSGDHIITRSMGRRILSVGLIFVAVIFGLMQYFRCYDITNPSQFSLSDFCHSLLNTTFDVGENNPYEMSLLFTIFVMLQFWNMFNARAFLTSRSAIRGLRQCIGFITAAIAIVVGQWLIVSLGGEMFDVVPLSTTDWIVIFVATSPVLIIGEIMRYIKKRQ